MNAKHEHEEVTIHIDKKEYKVKNPITGAALYEIGKIKEGFELFKEVHGQGDDLLIANDVTVYTLKNGDQFYSAKKELNPGK